jgi:DNA-binding response OmpR family regulator
MDDVSQTYKIMIVEPDAELLEILVSGFSARFDAYLTCVPDATACLDAELLEPHDLVVAALDLPDSDGLALSEHLATLGPRPVILLASDPDSNDVLTALRLGVRDVLCKPFPLAELLDSADDALRDYTLHRQHMAKYHRMRELVRHVIRERRELNRRTELVCKDLVGAHKRLVTHILSKD